MKRLAALSILTFLCALNIYANVDYGLNGWYDSSADYWKINEKGRLEYDGVGWLKDKDGNYIGKDGKKYSPEEFAKLGERQDALIVGKSGIEGGLAEIMFGNSVSKEQLEQVRQLMIASGITKGYKYRADGSTDFSDMFWGNDLKSGAHRAVLDYYSDQTGAYRERDLTAMNMGKELNMDKMMGFATNTVNETLFTSYYQDQINDVANGNYPARGLNSRAYAIGAEIRDERARFGIEIRDWKNIQSLHPDIRQATIDLFTTAKARGSPLAFAGGLLSSFRTAEEQESLYSKGRDEAGNIIGEVVTYARAWESYHNYGLAMDLYMKGDLTDDGYRKMADLAQEFGFEAGYYWEKWQDKPHIQFTFGLSESQLRKLYLEKHDANNYLIF